MFGISANGEEMMPQVTVGRWGRSLAIRLPDEIARAAGISDGERIEVEVRDGGIMIRRAGPHFTLEELFRGKTAQQWRAIYGGAFDWGADVGGEAVEE